MLARDLERLAQPARTRAQQTVVRDSASRAHRLEPFNRLERANQHCTRDADVLTDEVQAPVHSVRAVDVRVARGAEHRRVAWSLAPEPVRGGIFVVVRLDLDDDPADEQHRADEIKRDFVDRAVEELAAQHRHTSLSRLAS